MAKRHSSRATRRNPPCVPAHIRDQLNVIVCVCGTLVDALSGEDHEDYAATLLECVLAPLRKIRDTLETHRS